MKATLTYTRQRKWKATRGHKALRTAVEQANRDRFYLGSIFNPVSSQRGAN